MVSIPCTGGSSWKHVNKGKGKKTRKLIAKRVRDFRLIWLAFERVCETAHKLGHPILIEWPKGCDYWRRREVVRLLKRYKFQSTTFNGCMYGLVSQVKATRGRPIAKPWRFDCTHPGMLAGFDRVCRPGPDGLCQHSKLEHVPCAGADTRLTEGYTDEMVKIIHNNFSKHCRVMLAGSGSPVSCGCIVSRAQVCGGSRLPPLLLPSVAPTVLGVLALPDPTPLVKPAVVARWFPSASQQSPSPVGRQVLHRTSMSGDGHDPARAVPWDPNAPADSGRTAQDFMVGTGDFAHLGGELRVGVDGITRRIPDEELVANRELRWAEILAGSGTAGTPYVSTPAPPAPSGAPPPPPPPPTAPSPIPLSGRNRRKPYEEKTKKRKHQNNIF